MQTMKSYNFKKHMWRKVNKKISLPSEVWFEHQQSLDERKNFEITHKPSIPHERSKAKHATLNGRGCYQLRRTIPKFVWKHSVGPLWYRKRISIASRWTTNVWTKLKAPDGNREFSFTSIIRNWNSGQLQCQMSGLKQRRDKSAKRKDNSARLFYKLVRPLW